MFNERAFISQVEGSSPDDLAALLLRPTLEEEKALRSHLGDERYQRMHSMALKRKVRRSAFAKSKGNVVVIHGILGAELTVSSGGPGDLTWVDPFRIARGWLDRLKLSEDGRTDANPKFKVTASGIMKRYYGEMLLSLAENWNVQAFWFDWRKDLELAADALNVQMGRWFDGKAPVHIVAHSMGGLVARTFIKKYASRWGTMWDKAGNGKAGGRLVMLGTPNQGSFAIPQLITGLEGLVRKLALIDLRHSVNDLLGTFNSFVGSCQLMPSAEEMPDIKPLYQSGTYSRFNVSVPQQHLDRAEVHHQWLKDAIDFDRMVYVAGFDQPTFSDVNDFKNLDKTKGYLMTLDGDGRVPHRLGRLQSPDGSKQVKTYYIKEEHGNLSTNSKILAALDDLLETGQTHDLLETLPARRAVQPSQQALRAQYEAPLLEDEAALGISLGRMSARSVQFPIATDDGATDTTTDASLPMVVSPEERKVEESITRGFLAYRGAGTTIDETADVATLTDKTHIEIGLVCAGIESIGANLNSKLPVDAIAVGHYIGVQPQMAELALDKAVSAALLPKGSKEPQKSDLILTQYTDRGIIYGKLGQPFLIPDPRMTKDRKFGGKGRLIAIAGMNEPGRFGVPELNVLARELCWALGRLDRKHLATVLIGGGDGNLSLDDSVSGWLTGIRHAVSGSRFDAGRRLERITFVEVDPRKAIQLDEIFTRQQQRLLENNAGFTILYTPFSDKKKSELKKEALKKAKNDLIKKWEKDTEQEAPSLDAIPSRVTLSLDTEKRTYRFAAITETASVPERDTVVDPGLVWTANDELAGEQLPSVQLERGRFLEALLIPADLRVQLYTPAPLVMMLDSTTARIHWEMVAQPSLDAPRVITTSNASVGTFEYEDDFLGTSRGFTRQLRTTFAGPPDPPPPPQGVLRVLIVADPAEDAHLPGAEEEAVAIADLFESFNNSLLGKTGTRIEVKRFFGPIEATRTNVLRELMLRRYDLLHFAGHCVFEWGGDPNLSGWIFNMKNKELLSANELNRVDRIPKFIFSNACESGVTPDRSQDRNDRLAPSFAEAFFARGVANFVCTAWPVDDVAARLFAVTLYSGLLGSEANTDQDALAQAPEPLPMHEAMKRARLAIARTANGRTTWGAYQHYGNPNFRLFNEQTESTSQESQAKKSAGKRKTGAKVKAKTRKRAKRGTSRK
jgi:hypothetical protein